MFLITSWLIINIPHTAVRVQVSSARVDLFLLLQAVSRVNMVPIKIICMDWYQKEGKKKFQFSFQIHVTKVSVLVLYVSIDTSLHWGLNEVHWSGLPAVCLVWTELSSGLEFKAASNRCISLNDRQINTMSRKSCGKLSNITKTANASSAPASFLHLLLKCMCSYRVILF